MKTKWTVSRTLGLTMLVLSFTTFAACTDSKDEESPQANVRDDSLAITLLLPEPECHPSGIRERSLSANEVNRLRAHATDLGAIAAERGTVFSNLQFNKYWTVQDTLNVQWIVAGGQAPCQVVIDGYDGSSWDLYDSASGEARIPCVLSTGNTAFTLPNQDRGDDVRTLWSMPLVTSGTKAIYARVTDGNGSVATTAIDTYVLSTAEHGQTLRGGESYRIRSRDARFRFLIPVVMNMTFSGIFSTSGCSKCDEIGLSVWIGDSRAWVTYAI